VPREGIAWSIHDLRKIADQLSPSPTLPLRRTHAATLKAPVGSSAVERGMRKVNVATQLNKVLADAVRDALSDPALVDPRRYLGPGRDAVAAEVARLLTLLAPAPY